MQYFGGFLAKKLAKSQGKCYNHEEVRSVLKGVKGGL